MSAPGSHAKNGLGDEMDLTIFRCVYCSANRWETRETRWKCRQCGQSYFCARGVPHLVHDRRPGRFSGALAQFLALPARSVRHAWCHWLLYFTLVAILLAAIGRITAYLWGPIGQAPEAVDVIAFVLVLAAVIVFFWQPRVLWLLLLAVPVKLVLRRGTFQPGANLSDIHAEWMNRFRRMARDRETSLRILDIATGTRMPPLSHDWLKLDAEYIAVGGSERMLRRRYGSMIREGHPIQLRVGDPQLLPIASGSIDIVLHYDMIHHGDRAGLLLREMDRVCKPDGLMLFSREQIHNRASLLERLYFNKVCPTLSADTPTVGDMTVHQLHPFHALCACVKQGHDPGDVGESGDRGNDGFMSAADASMVISRIGRPTLEIHIPISPTALFFNMIRCFTLSLRKFGGAYANAPVIVTTGETTADPGLSDRLPWLKSLGVELRWAPEEEYRIRSHSAQSHQRFNYAHRSDVVLLMDADILIAGPIDEMVERVYRDQVVAGLISHVTPFTPGTGRDWHGLFRHCGVGQPRLQHEHTGWGYMFNDAALRYCPSYFNFGVVCGPRIHISAIGRMITAMHEKVSEYYPDSFFRGQLALAAAIASLGLPTWALPMRFNFPNDPFVEALHHEEIPHVRIIHMLRNHQGVYKNELFADIENLRAFLRRPDMRVINRRAQEIIRSVWRDLTGELMAPRGAA
jgi:SAM-dependent methyltransferase